MKRFKVGDKIRVRLLTKKEFNNLSYIGNYDYNSYQDYKNRHIKELNNNPNIYKNEEDTKYVFFHEAITLKPYRKIIKGILLNEI